MARFKKTRITFKRLMRISLRTTIVPRSERFSYDVILLFDTFVQCDGCRVLGDVYPPGLLRRATCNIATTTTSDELAFTSSGNPNDSMVSSTHGPDRLLRRRKVLDSSNLSSTLTTHISPPSIIGCRQPFHTLTESSHPMCQNLNVPFSNYCLFLAFSCHPRSYYTLLRTRGSRVFKFIHPCTVRA